MSKKNTLILADSTTSEEPAQPAQAAPAQQAGQQQQQQPRAPDSSDAVCCCLDMHICTRVDLMNPRLNGNVGVYMTCI
jgi:hypothetical protein